MPTFVEQAVTAAWRWRRDGEGWSRWPGRPRSSLSSRVSPSLLLRRRGSRRGFKALAFASGHAVPWLIAYATVAMDWWWTLAHVGGVIASALMTPARVVAIFGVELFGILAFFALQRIAGAGRLGDAQV